MLKKRLNLFKEECFLESIEVKKKMILDLAALIKYEAKTPEEQAELEKKIGLLGQHIDFHKDVAPRVIDDKTGRVREQFLVRWRNEAVQIFPVGGRLPEYRLSSRGKDERNRMLNVYEHDGHAWISLRTSLQEEYTHYYLFRNPE